MTTDYDLLNIKADNGSLVLPQQTDYRLRQAFAQAGLEDAFEDLRLRRDRVQSLKDSCDKELSSLLAIAVILYQHEELEGMTGYLEVFKTEILDKQLEIPAYQISRILGAAKVKAQAKTSATATDQERQLIAEMSSCVAYEYSKLNLLERKACLEDHVSRGKEPSKRSVMSFKRHPVGGAKKVVPPQPLPVEQPPLPTASVDVVAVAPEPTAESESVTPSAGEIYLTLKRSYRGIHSDQDRRLWQHLAGDLELLLRQIKCDLRGGDIDG